MSESALLSIHGVGSNMAENLKALGINDIDDLIKYYPRRYDDYSNISQIAKLTPGNVSVRGEIKQITGRYVRRGMHVTEAIASDDTGSVRLVWFNQPYRAQATKKGHKYYISGSFEMARGKLSIMNPSMELASNFPVNTARIVPVYRETKGIKSAAIRKLIAGLRDDILSLPENLPDKIVSELDLMSRADATLAMHFPKSEQQLSDARRRLGFEEVFALSLASYLNKLEYSREKTHTISFNEKLAQHFVKGLPFELTGSQRKAAWQIYRDMQSDMPMNRLLEGDVGSGKTVVAAMAALMVIENGYQVTLMAPTELLARQHAENLYRMMEAVGRHKEVALLVGSQKATQKTGVHKLIKIGTANFIVGTHALIADKVAMRNLGLVIVDEQHRFGVEQRKQLQKKADGRMPHVLSMTATPIPRSLALTLYGELDISLLIEKPKNRKPIITKLVSPNARLRLYQKTDNEIERGRQIFVVAPLIGQMHDEMEEKPAVSAEKLHEELSRGSFKHRRVGLLHGKMKADAKEKIMEQFVNHELDILVSTTVIEVGVDVPNASVMVIEGVERFGLAQIHQLRGRVGRSNDQGYCYLIMSDSKHPSRRLLAVESSTDGFRLSELDLELRGPGAIYGQSQSGQLDLRIAKLTDVRLIENARAAARNFADSGEDLEKYPELASRVKQYRSVTNLN